jgi:peptide/nickel transport system substrate-binding protein
VRRAAVVLGVVSLLALAVVALAATTRDSGDVEPRDRTIRVSQPADLRSTDPALAQRAAWELEYATCAKLYNYDARGRVVPELAASRDGTTFRIARGWRFSDGRVVTARDVAATIRRVLHPEMVSPGATYLRDVTDVVAREDRVTLDLAREVPDLEHRLALPYFCVVPYDTPLDARGVDVVPSAGPYYVAERTYRRSLLLKRNPYYGGKRKRGPERISYTFGVFPAQVTLQLQRGEADLGPVPPEEVGALARRYGLNGTRLHIASQDALAFLALNTERPLFKDNPRLRQAVNYAIDRRILTRQLGAYGGRPTDQMLTPGTPGFRDARIYPVAPDLERARALATGNLRDGVASYWTCSDAACRTRAEAVQDALGKIGIRVKIRVLYGAGIAARRVAQRGEGFDITDGFWQPEYPDPYGLLQRLLSGRELRRTENTNLSYFHDPALDRRLDELARLEGQARYDAFAALDADVTRRLAPIVPYATLNVRAFVSDRVGCVRFHPVYGLDLAALCLRD